MKSKILIALLVATAVITVFADGFVGGNAGGGSQTISGVVAGSGNPASVSFTTAGSNSIAAIAGGVVSANVAYVSAAYGTTNGIVGNPAAAFNTMSAAVAACPSGGTVAVVDGTFHETPVVNSPQTWWFADNTYLDHFSVTPGASTFNIFGLGSFGYPDSVGIYITNNYNNFRIECKNFWYSTFGPLYLSSTNSNPFITVIARDQFNISAIDFLDSNPATIDITATSITNVYTPLVNNPYYTTPNKSYNFHAHFMHIMQTGSGIPLGQTNTSVLYDVRNLVLTGSSTFRYGDWLFQTNGQRLAIVGADISEANIFGTIIGFQNAGVTNDITFQNCRLNLLTNWVAHAGAAYEMGGLNFHLQGCTALTAFVPVTGTSGYATNTYDNTFIDPTWTNNAVFRY